MHTVLLVILFAVLPVVGVLSAAYWRYRTSPAGAWKHRLRAHAGSLLRRQAVLRHESAQTREAVTHLADEAFQRHLQTIPVARLADFPNIGPATTGKLEDAGYRRVGDVVGAKFVDLAGIGERRAKDLILAVRALVKEARSRFDAGACLEAQEYRRQVDHLRRAEQEHTAARGRELAAVTVALNETFDLLRLVDGVTFLGFLLRRDVPGLTPEVLARPLPVVTVAEPAPVIPIPPPVTVVGEVVAGPTPAPFPLPPVPASLPPPTSPPPDLFRAALKGDVKSPETATERPGLARMRAVIGLGFVVAKADGKVAQAERKAIRAYLEQSFAHDPVLLRNIDPLMERVEKAIPGADDALAAVRAAVPAAERPALYQWAERIAHASGAPNAKERDALARIAAGLGVLPSPARGEGGERSEPGEGSWTAGVPPALQHAGGTPAVQRPKNPSPPTPLPQGERGEADDPRAVLDIAPDTPLDADLIRRRFALLTDKLDPAKAAAFGPEFVRMAAEKRAGIRAAAEALIAPLGEPLEKPAAPPPADLRHNPDLDDVFGA